MKVIELLEYKNKYYKAIPKKPKPRAKKTLWYDVYDDWVGDVAMRFPDTRVFYDEENEEIFAASDDCKECYGKWSKKNKSSYKGVTFFKPRNTGHVTRNAKKLKRIEVKKKEQEKEKESTGGGFSALF